MQLQSLIRCARRDRKSTRLNSSHSQISYAVFCLKKKKSQIAIDEEMEVLSTIQEIPMEHRLRYSYRCIRAELHWSVLLVYFLSFFFFNDTATTEIYTLSLHDALPIRLDPKNAIAYVYRGNAHAARNELDRKSTRLNSSHSQISYAVFCLKKKKKK